ncbi:MAG: hypothetical protein LM522_06160 [Candidatus Contendobacter sp.]|nr:hypothetical protein [Candidatus Contendobacter sp.]
MNESIANIGNCDLRNAVKALYCAANVLKNLPYTQADQDTKTALFISAKLAIKSVRIVLGNITDSLETIEANQL